MRLEMRAAAARSATAAAALVISAADLAAGFQNRSSSMSDSPEGLASGSRGSPYLAARRDNGRLVGLRASVYRRVGWTATAGLLVDTPSLWSQMVPLGFVTASTEVRVGLVRS